MRRRDRNASRSQYYWRLNARAVVAETGDATYLMSMAIDRKRCVVWAGEGGGTKKFTRENAEV